MAKVIEGLTVELSFEPSSQFHAIATWLGYKKEKSCNYEHRQVEGYTCSNCRYVWLDEIADSKPNFCPHCGYKVINEVE